jgi:hypothetical protein
MRQSDPASLANLHDIVSAQPVPWWPLAPGWYFLAAILLIVLTLGFWRWLCLWRSNAYRRAALVQLEHLESQLRVNGQRQASLRALPELVKRTALCVWPRQEVAPLSGEEWLTWLDCSWSRKDFSKGAGRLLPQLAYADTDSLFVLTALEVNALFDLIRNWIRLHRRPHSDNRGGRHA